MINKYYEIFLKSGKIAGFSDKQLEQLSKKIIENAFKFSVAEMFEILGKRMKEEEIKEFKNQFEKEVKVKADSFSAEQIIELVRRIFRKYMTDEEITEVTDKAFRQEYLLTAKKILDQLDPRDGEVISLQRKIDSDSNQG